MQNTHPDYKIPHFENDYTGSQNKITSEQHFKDQEKKTF